MLNQSQAMYNAIRHVLIASEDNGDMDDIDWQGLRGAIDSISYDGTNCPRCGSENLRGDEIEPEGSSLAFRRCACEDCGATWDERFEVMGYGNLEVKQDAEA